MQLLECYLTIDDLDTFLGTIGEHSDRHGTTIQAFDARYVADRAHLERAVELADRAIDREKNVARDRAVEILLYAAGRRQIDRAFEMGVTEGEQAAVLLVADTDGGAADRSVDGTATAPTDAEEATVDALRDLAAIQRVEPTLDEPDVETLQAFFDITDAERSATDASIGALVRERVVLLEVEK